jgi:VanZ family protein
LNLLSALTLRRARILAVAWALFLFALTSWPSPPEVPVVSAIPNFDKVVHAILYGVQGFLLYLAIRWKPRRPGPVHRGPAAEEEAPEPGPPRFSWKRTLLVGLIMMVWGSLDEIHQLWIPGRSCELGDAVTDTIAGFLGAVAASRVAASVRRTEP